jgi:hypothetical protein
MSMNARPSKLEESLGPEQFFTYAGYEEMKEGSLKLSDLLSEDKENVSLYSNLPVLDKENLQASNGQKFGTINSIPINSKCKYSDKENLFNLNRTPLANTKRKREQKRAPLQMMREDYDSDSPDV